MKDPIVCPSCGEKLESINYTKSFYFDDLGRRYDGVWSWVTDCCGTEWLDSQLTFDLMWEPGETGWVPAVLSDSITGEPLLTWLDNVPDGEDCVHDE